MFELALHWATSWTKPRAIYLIKHLWQAIQNLYNTICHMMQVAMFEASHDDFGVSALSLIWELNSQEQIHGWPGKPSLLCCVPVLLCLSEDQQIHTLALQKDSWNKNVTSISSVSFDIIDDPRMTVSISSSSQPQTITVKRHSLRNLPRTSNANLTTKSMPCC